MPVRVPQTASFKVRGERFKRGVAFGGESVPTSRGIGHFGVPLLLVNHGLQILGDGPALGRGARAVVTGIEARLTAHSGRAGLASELTARGASTTEVMLAGNWKTARMVAHYSAGRDRRTRGRRQVPVERGNAE